MRRSEPIAITLALLLALGSTGHFQGFSTMRKGTIAYLLAVFNVIGDELRLSVRLFDDRFLFGEA